MKKNTYIWLFLITLLLAGCRPNGVLSSSEMRDVLIDLHKTDALLQVCGYQHGYDEVRNIYYAMVLQEHGITQAEFDSSLVWYTAHPQLFDKIYPKVLAAIEKERDQYYEAHKDEFGPETFDTHTPNNDTPPTTNNTILTTKEAQQKIDSILWVGTHGLPSHWNPYTPTIQIPLTP